MNEVRRCEGMERILREYPTTSPLGISDSASLLSVQTVLVRRGPPKQRGPQQLLYTLLLYSNKTFFKISPHFLSVETIATVT